MSPGQELLIKQEHPQNGKFNESGPCYRLPGYNHIFVHNHLESCRNFDIPDYQAKSKFLKLPIDFRTGRLNPKDCLISFIIIVSKIQKNFLDFCFS